MPCVYVLSDGKKIRHVGGGRFTVNMKIISAFIARGTWIKKVNLLATYF